MVHWYSFYPLFQSSLWNHHYYFFFKIDSATWCKRIHYTNTVKSNAHTRRRLLGRRRSTATSIGYYQIIKTINNHNKNNDADSLCIYVHIYVCIYIMYVNLYNNIYICKYMYVYCVKQLLSNYYCKFYDL